MKYSFYNQCKNYLLLQHFKCTHVQHDISARHRFELYQVFLVFSFLVLLVGLFQYPFALWSFKPAYIVYNGIFISVFISYFLIPFSKHVNLFYYYMIFSLYALIHIVTYFTGGIQASAGVYLTCLVLSAYMLLGKRGGNIMTAIALLHTVYFLLISEYTNWCNMSLISNEKQLLHLDFFATITLAVIIIRNLARNISRTHAEVITETLHAKNQLAEIEMKALRAQMNPHFIYNVLNSIQYFFNQNDTENANKYLSKFSRLIRKILDNSSHSFISLNDELTALQLYLELEKLRFENRFEYSITVDSIINSNSFKVPSMILQPIAENCIKHGFDSLTIHGKINVGIHLKQNLVECIIRDNGKGRNAMSADATNHKGKATQIIVERLALLNSIYKTKCHILINDLLETENACGTEVIITLPINTG